MIEPLGVFDDPICDEPDDVEDVAVLGGEVDVDGDWRNEE